MKKLIITKDTEEREYENNDATVIIIEEGVTSIKSFTFAGCKNLRKVIIAGTVTHISEGAFSKCEQLRTVIVRPSKGILNTCKIRNGAFIHCEKIRNLKDKSNRVRAERHAFICCALKGKIKV